MDPPSERFIMTESNFHLCLGIYLRKDKFLVIKIFLSSCLMSNDYNTEGIVT